jgi:hypothetical protein
MIINNNIIGTTIVRKLNLNNVKHHKPYILQLLNECSEDKVTKQVLVSFFFIERYYDKVLCDVVPMHVSQLLLGRPW